MRGENESGHLSLPIIPVTLPCSHPPCLSSTSLSYRVKKGKQVLFFRGPVCRPRPKTISVLNKYFSTRRLCRPQSYVSVRHHRFSPTILLIRFLLAGTAIVDFAT